MDKEGIIGQLHANLTALSCIQNLNEAYKLTGYVFNLLQKLEPLDKLLSEKLSALFVTASASADLEEIHMFATAGLAALGHDALEEAIVTEPEKIKNPVGNARRIIRSKDYLRAIKKQYYALIEQAERDIIAWPRYQKKLHDLIDRGKYFCCRHARFYGNLRIMYFFDVEQKKLVYADILTKNDFDNSLNRAAIDWKAKFRDL
jgi:hypothetical protein